MHHAQVSLPDKRTVYISQQTDKRTDRQTEFSSLDAFHAAR